MTAMELPVVYVAPGQLLAEVSVDLDGWERLGDTMRALAANEIPPRLTYAYQLPESNRLLAKLILDVSAAGPDEAALSSMLSAVRGLRVVSIQTSAETGLVMSKQQRPELVGTPVAIFGRSIIGSLTHGILET